MNDQIETQKRKSHKNETHAHSTHSFSKSQQLIQEYEEHHQNGGNKIAHYIGIPLILSGLFGLLAWIPLPHFFISWNGARLLLALIVLFYLLLDFKKAVPFSLVILAFYFFGTTMHWYTQIGFLAAGLGLQAAGHIWFEKESKNFVTDVTHFLIGPLWIFTKVMSFNKTKK